MEFDTFELVLLCDANDVTITIIILYSAVAYLLLSEDVLNFEIVSLIKKLLKFKHWELFTPDPVYLKGREFQTSHQNSSRDLTDDL